MDQKGYNWFLFIDGWGQAFSETRQTTLDFLKTYISSAMLLEPGTVTDSQRLFLEWVADLAQNAIDWINKLMRPDAFLNNVQWINFLKAVARDCYFEDIQDGESKGCDFAEFCEALGRNIAIFARVPDFWQVTFNGVAIAQFMNPAAELFRYYAKACGENVGIPGDPYEYWKWAHGNQKPQGTPGHKPSWPEWLE